MAMRASNKIKLIAFDLDGTLSESKSPITPKMASMLRELLRRYHVAVTSGQKFSRFQKQLINRLKASPGQLKYLHILPTNGNQYFRYDIDKKRWQRIYFLEMPVAERKRITKKVKTTAKRLGLWVRNPRGKIIEDRGSQITFSALGQKALLKPKKAWDPKKIKRRRLRTALAKILPGYATKTAGTTSIDITAVGLNKAAAITRLKDILGLTKSDLMYVGDALGPGENDAVVKAAGFKTIGVKGPTETAERISKLLEGY